MRIGPGDEVIVPANTYMASILAISENGLKPILVEPDIMTYNIDPNLIEEKITTKTKAIMAVHLYGQIAAMNEINAIAKKYNLKVIEDSAQAHGAIYNGKKAGSLADVACFSFFPSKNVTVLGDGGMITTNDGELARMVGMLRNHGRAQKYIHEVLGLNFRLSEVHATIGREQLKHLTEWTERRRAIAAQYNALLHDSGVVIPVERKWAKHVYYMYVIRVKQRDNLASYLKDKGIETGIHYPVPVHRQPYLMSDVHLPITEQYVDEILSLPMHPQLRDEEVDYVASEVRNFMENAE